MPQEPPEITSLIKGCCQNNRNSQRELYQWLYGYAMKISFRYINDLSDAEDLVSESFVKLFKNLDQFNFSLQSDLEALLKAWFKRIIVNTCIDHLRKTHLKLISYDVAPEKETASETQESGLDKIAYQEIIESVRLLSPVYRTVFNLFVIEGFSHEEIANQLKISIGASKSNLSKARQNLRKLIKEKKEYKQYA
ncbi:MAG: RNA polymerase sigma factor [Chitinophagaceae bacterium]|nr:RNA polymerase sigma factor [Chitinophagaceae bacterium]